MEKKLPKVFANPQEKKFTNNEKVYYSKENITQGLISQHEKDGGEQLRGIDSKNIYQKINDIFSSEKYVYKAEVDIITKSGTIKTKVIGQNRTHIITMDNELISIADIEDIKFSEQKKA